MMEVNNIFAQHPKNIQGLSANELRENFLIPDIFKPDTIQATYTHYDRMIVGGISPITKELTLLPMENLKANFFLERREIGIINVGGKGWVLVNNEKYTLDHTDALYIGKGNEEVIFGSEDASHPAFFYFNSTPAHASYATKKVSKADVTPVELGSVIKSNQRKIYKLLVAGAIDTCQVQMGLTELTEGSNWNTMPPHTHDRRMEAYFYFNLSEEDTVCHFLGEPQETKHIWMKNHQAVLSPPWSIHSGVGTSNYSFIWGMAGENLDYGDMDHVLPIDLR